MPSPPSPWRLRSARTVAAFLVGGVLVFAGAWRTWFIGDDFEGVLAVSSGPSWEWLWNPGLGGHARPLVWWTLWVDRQLWGLGSVGWHLVPVACHGIAAWLVGILVASIAVGDHDRRQRWGLLAGTVFLVAPNHVEPIAWIAGRGDPLATVLALACVVAWSRARGGRRAWTVASLGALVVAFLAKETVVALPLVLLAFEVVLPDGDRSVRARLRAAGVRLGGAFAITAAFVARTLASNPFYATGSGATLGGGPLVAARRGLQVVARSVLPGMPVAAWLVVAVGIAVVAVALVVGRLGRFGPAWGRLAEQGRPLGFLALATLVLAAPVAGYGVAMTASAGERLAYLPSAFALGAVGLALGVLADAPRRIWRVGVAAVVVGALLAVSATQVYVRGGLASRRLVLAAQVLDAERGATILVAPDTLEGAWVQRNGLDASLHVVQGWPADVHVQQLLGATFPNGDHRVLARTGRCAGCLTLRLADPEASFLGVGEALPASPEAGVRVVRLTRREADVVIDRSGLRDAPPIYYVSDERYVPVEGVD